MKINVLKTGDEVVNVTQDFVAVRRKNGEVDILPLVQENGSLWVDAQNVLTIGYGMNSVEVQTEDGITVQTF